LAVGWLHCFRLWQAVRGGKDGTYGTDGTNGNRKLPTANGQPLTANG
jgi:hypothetical protein